MRTPQPFGADGQWDIFAVGPATTIDDVLIADDSYSTNGEAPYLNSESQTFKEAPFVLRQP